MTGAAGGQQRLLYFFTPLSDVDRIVRDAAILADAAVPLGPLARLLSRTRDFVWLCDASELQPEQARGLAAVRPGVTCRASELARITVSVFDAQYWPRWARRHGVGRRRRYRFDRAAGGLTGRWWIVPRSIPSGQWLRIDAVTGGRLWPRDGRHAAAPAQFPLLSAFRRPQVDWPVQPQAPRPRPHRAPS